MTGETYDGHVHTCLSDADPDQTPREVCRQARAAGLTHLAITDHDFMLDREERLALEEEFDLDVIPGCELSARTEISGIPHNVHIGGHWLNEQEPRLRQVLRVNQSQDFEAFRKEILRRCLRCGLDPGGEGDVDRSYQMLLERNPQSNHYGRREVARLLAETGCVSSVREAQDQYLSAHGKRRAYVPGERYLRFAPLEQVVEAIRASGGIATLNHLYAYRLRQEEEEALVRQFRDLGGQALEVVYSRYTPQQRERLMDYCQCFGLLPNCGSDRHAAEKPFQQGDGDLFRRLRDRCMALRGGETLPTGENRDMI